LKERARAAKRKKIASTLANEVRAGAVEVIEKEGKVTKGPTLSPKLEKDNNRKRKRKRNPMTQRSSKKRKVSHKSSSSCDIDPVATPTEEDDDDDVILEQEMKEWVELGVPRPLMRALHDLKFHRPTEIQRRAIPLVAKGDNDIIGAAETVRHEIYCKFGNFHKVDGSCKNSLLLCSMGAIRMKN
jgi:hypothetical protein